MFGQLMTDDQYWGSIEIENQPANLRSKCLPKSGKNIDNTSCETEIEIHALSYPYMAKNTTLRNIKIIVSLMSSYISHFIGSSEGLIYWLEKGIVILSCMTEYFRVFQSLSLHSYLKWMVFTWKTECMVSDIHWILEYERTVI